MCDLWLPCMTIVSSHLWILRYRDTDCYVKPGSLCVCSNIPTVASREVEMSSEYGDVCSRLSQFSVISLLMQR